MDSEDLRAEAESAAEKLASGVDVEANDEKAVRLDKRNDLDEKLEKDLNTEEGVWSREEVEYLVNNRHKMSNDEMKEFLNRGSDFQDGEFERFSEAEEEVVMRNFPMKDAEEIADKLDRTEEEVKKKVKMLGLGNRLE